MNERFAGHNYDTKQFDTIATRGWSDPSRREAFERHLGTSLGEYGYEFNESQHRQMRAVDMIANRVAADLSSEYGVDFRSVHKSQFDNPDGTFSRGVILFGASSREDAELIQPEFTHRVNEVLEALEANVRLGEHNQ